ncbi:hypothetical protein ACJ41O_009399 [Fusarium nematophilum]
MAFIRPYEPRDFDAMAHICRETLPPSLDASRGAHLLAPYLWTHPYTHHSPSTCLVLDSGDGTAVGYCIACPDVLALMLAWPGYLAAVGDPSDASTAAADDDDDVVGRELRRLVHDPRAVLIGGCEELAVEGVRATMHIDLLGEWQRRGWGAKLVEGVVARLTERSEDLSLIDVGVIGLSRDDHSASSGGEPQTQTQTRGGGGGGGGICRGVYVGVAGENSKVVPFYERMGFQIWHEKGRGGREEASQDETIMMVREFPGRDKIGRDRNGAPGGH